MILLSSLRYPGVEVDKHLLALFCVRMRIIAVEHLNIANLEAPR